MTDRPVETTSEAYRRGVAAARQVRQSTIVDLNDVIDAGDDSREPERNLRLWMRDRLQDAENEDGPT